MDSFIKQSECSHTQLNIPNQDIEDFYPSTPIIFFKQQDMFLHADSHNHSCFIATDTPFGGKSYSSFLSHNTFLQYYNTIPDTEKHHNELIRLDHPFYEYYDLDLKFNGNTNLYSNENLFNWFTTIRTEFLKTLPSPQKFNEKWSITTASITTASNTSKLSLHLVNNNTIFTSHATYKKYYQKFKQYITNFTNKNDPFSNAIDFCVSSVNRCMRICESSKIDAYRPLILWNTKDITQTFITYTQNSNAHKIDNQDIEEDDKNEEENKENKEIEKIVEKEIDDHEIENKEKKRKKNKNITIEHSCELITKLLSILSPDRYNNYNDWITIGMALKNKDHSLFTIWDTWSKQSPKYSNNIQHIWDKFTTDHSKPLTIGTIHFYAKQDNPEQYQEIIDEHSHKTIDISTFTPHYTFSEKYVPDHTYISHIKNVIALKSNMNTGKTHGMPILFNSYQRILVFYHRISLNLSIYNKWAEYGFTLYSDIDTYHINLDQHPRIICQIDSIHRIIGQCDLLILDELESTHEHLCGSKMLNDTDKCYRTLANYIRYTPKIIACDANLKDETCDIFFHNKEIIKLENTYQSFSNRMCYLFYSKIKLIEQIYILIDNNKNIVIPTNSKTYAKKIEKLIQHHSPITKILRIDSENGFVPIEEWKKYNVVIYTPTITAGISFDKTHFHSVVAFFSNKSASAEQCSQMLFRVRHVIDQNLFIYVDPDTSSKPTDDISLTHHIQNIIFYNREIEGIDIDRYNKKVIENDYFKLYRLYLKKINMSNGCFKSYMIHLLKEHGIKIKNYYDTKITSDFTEICKSLKNITDEIKEEDATDIVNATHINKETYLELLNSKTSKTKEQMISIKRYILTSAFDLPNNTHLDIEWVKHNIKYYNGYRHYKLFSNDTIDQSIEKCKQLIEHLESTTKITTKRLLPNKDTEYVTITKKIGDKKINVKVECNAPNDDIIFSDSETEEPYRKQNVGKFIHSKLHSDKTLYKLYHCLQFVKTSGFNSLSDIDKIKINYNDLHSYCKENEEKIRTCFDRSKKMEWKTLDANEKNALSKYVNQKLEACFGIRLSREGRGGTYSSYGINRLFT